MAFSRAYGHKEGRLLYEHDRLLACGIPKVRLRRATTLSLDDTVKWARRIPRAGREAQGFTRIRDFALNVKQLREKRAKLRKPQPAKCAVTSSTRLSASCLIAPT